MACHTCGSVHHYPRPFCPDCWSAEVESQEASGRATLYTWSTVHMNDLPPFKERVPYVAAVVELVEGPRVMTNIVGCDEAELFIGMELEVAYQELTDAITVAVFQPARDSCVQG
ncbi:Zn-ribbon domain-containing OB-fold protein [Rhodococcus wratislaviensis]|uniref:Zn-ribbon domain-containing OB-fold protein n=1 Tax=Rhodococcus wratislaviensis TaxID=44752 RepID=UPI00364DE845